MTPDSEIVVQFSGLGPDDNASIAVTLSPSLAIQMDDYGDSASCDLLIQIVSPTVDTTCYSLLIPVDLRSRNC